MSGIRIWSALRIALVVNKRPKDLVADGSKITCPLWKLRF